MSYTRQALYPCNPGTERGRSTKLATANVKGADKVIYTNGRSVIVLDLQNPGLSTSFNGHAKETTAARFSPSGYYCASADVSGIVKIWDTVGEDQTVSAEYKVLSGRINDLAWDADSDRIIAAGDGREKFAHAFLRSTGTGLGEITGHSKVLNAVSFRPKRPYRAVTCGDDGLINFHQGPPFKFVKSIREHTKFVQDVKYSPDGNSFVSVGSDLKVILYNGDNGDKIADFTDSPHKGSIVSPHKGSIMACSWNPGSTQFVTSSMDNTVKLWDAGAQKNLTTLAFDKGVPNQQVGNVWVNQNEVLSLSMGGDLHVIDVRAANKASRVIQAPQKSVTSATKGPSTTFFTGCADGRAYKYDTASGAVSTKVWGEGHINLISAMTATEDGKVYSSGFDDKLREVDMSSSGFTPALLSLDGQPKALASAADGTVFVVQVENTGKSKVHAIRDNQVLCTLSPPYKAVSVAASGTIVAVGGEDDDKIHVYTWNGPSSKLDEMAISAKTGSRGQITTLAVSQNEEYVAAGDSVGRIVLFNSRCGKLAERWTHHAGRITSLSFNPTNTHLASTSLDTHVYVYSLAAPYSKQVHVRGAAPMGGAAVFWLEEGSANGKGRVVSTGADGCVRVWDVTLP